MPSLPVLDSYSQMLYFHSPSFLIGVLYLLDISYGTVLYVFICFQGAMLIMAYFMIAGAYWAHKDPTDLKGR